MNGHRIIVYNVPQGSELVAIEKAAQAYKARYGRLPENVTLPKDVPESLVLVGGSLSVNGLQLELDKHFASMGTVQVGR